MRSNVLFWEGQKNDWSQVNTRYLFHFRTLFWTPSERPRSTLCAVFSPWKPLASLTALMASPWVGLGRRCPQWMYRWSDINSGPQKCSTLLGYTGKVGRLWHLDLIPACADVIFLLIVAVVFQNHTRCREDFFLAFPSCFLFLLKWEASFIWTF